MNDKQIPDFSFQNSGESPSVSFADSSPKGGAKGLRSRYLTREEMEAAAFKVCFHAFTFADDYNSNEMRAYIDGCMALIDELCGEGAE